VTVTRMRFCLSQLSVWHPPSAHPLSKPLTQVDTSRSSYSRNLLSETDCSLNSVGNGSASSDSCDCCSRRQCKIDGVSANIFQVCHDMAGIPLKLSDRVYNRNDGVVTGFYLQHGPEPSDTVMFWLYGGAFLSGDSKGNLNIGK